MPSEHCSRKAFLLLEYRKTFSPFPVDEILRKLTELLSAVNMGKDSL